MHPFFSLSGFYLSGVDSRLQQLFPKYFGKGGKTASNIDQQMVEIKADFEKLLYFAGDGKPSEMQALRSYDIESFFMYLKNKEKKHG